MTHEDAVKRIVDAIVNPPPPMQVSAGHIARVREALLAITVPAKLFEELGSDLSAIREATAAAAEGGEHFRTVELAPDQVPLEQQVAAWQAMALRISEEKAAIERRLRGLAARIAAKDPDFVEANDLALVELLAFVSSFLPVTEGGA